MCRRGRSDSACTLRGGAAFLAKGAGDTTTARKASPSGKRSPRGTLFIGRSGRGLRCGMGDPDPWLACPNGTMLFLHEKNYSAVAWKLLRRSPYVFQWIVARLAKLLRGVLETTPRLCFSIHIFPTLFARGVRGVVSQPFNRKVGI